MDTTKSPKVFISYSWGDQEHQMKVLALATSLVNDGINVLLDKWELSAGNDMNHFMEKSVNDPKKNEEEGFSSSITVITG